METLRWEVLLWTECLGPPAPRPYAEALMPLCDGLGRCGLWEAVGLEEARAGSPRQDQCPIRGGRDVDHEAKPHGDRARRQPSATQGQSSHRTPTLVTLTLTSYPQNWEKTPLCCFSHTPRLWSFINSLRTKTSTKLPAVCFSFLSPEQPGTEADGRLCGLWSVGRSVRRTREQQGDWPRWGSSPTPGVPHNTVAGPLDKGGNGLNTKQRKALDSVAYQGRHVCHVCGVGKRPVTSGSQQRWPGSGARRGALLVTVTVWPWASPFLPLDSAVLLGR